MKTKYVIILDSEDFVFENWDEKKFFNSDGQPRYFYWISKKRKSDWDYQMYRGSAYILRSLPGCKNIMKYANSDKVKRYISGVQIFSTENVAYFWKQYGQQKQFKQDLETVFSADNDLVFSDYTMYGLANEYGLFDSKIPMKIHNNLFGWYDNHDDENFHKFKKGAMWSMCQQYDKYQNPNDYYNFMKKTAKKLDRSLPETGYWNIADRKLIENNYTLGKNINYFKKYRNQLDYTERTRYLTMFEALRILQQVKKESFIIVETGTLRDSNIGGGHSTYKFAEFCSKFGGFVYTVDISDEAISFSQSACKDYLPWIKFRTSNSIEFLKNIDKKIDLLYLDSLDFHKGYKQAQLKQLEEIKTAEPHLSDKCIVLLDDAGLTKEGKTKLASDFLIKNNFELIIDSYQRLFIRGIKEKVQSPIKKFTTIQGHEYERLLNPNLKKDNSTTNKRDLNEEIRNIKKQDQEIKKLKHDLNKITSAKFYKMWQFYCTHRDGLKKYLLNLFAE
jgi:hypothetical protein